MKQKKKKSSNKYIVSFKRNNTKFIYSIRKNVEDLQKKINDKKTIKIGIIGAPNVGKNSLIQSLELIINADCSEKYIYFNEDKTFCINSVPGVLFDEAEENNFLISKNGKILKK